MRSVVITENVYSDVPKGTIGIIKEQDGNAYTILTKQGRNVFETGEFRFATQREIDDALSKRRKRYVGNCI